MRRSTLPILLAITLLGCGDDEGSGAQAGFGGAGAGGAGTGGQDASGAGGSGGATSSSGGGGAGPTCDGTAAECADTFGELFAPSNGRADGTLLAIVRTTDSQCALFNDDHVVLEVTILGSVQRLVVNVEGVAVAATQAPLLGPPFEEGWHEDQELDYPTDLDLHSDTFDQVDVAGAEGFLCEHLVPGQPISVFAYAEGNPSSAHQIHFNPNYPDGAIVANPTSETPTYLAFRFADQDF